VGEVLIVGGLERAINIRVDGDRLDAYKIPITRVAEALVRQTTDVPGGNVTAGEQDQTLRTIGRISDPKALNDLVIDTVNHAPIRIADSGYAEASIPFNLRHLSPERGIHAHPRFSL